MDLVVVWHKTIGGIVRQNTSNVWKKIYKALYSSTICGEKCIFPYHHVVLYFCQKSCRFTIKIHKWQLPVAIMVKLNSFNQRQFWSCSSGHIYKKLAAATQGFSASSTLSFRISLRATFIPKTDWYIPHSNIKAHTSNDFGNFWVNTWKIDHTSKIRLDSQIIKHLSNKNISGKETTI